MGEPPGAIDGKRVAASLPDGVRVYYFNLFDDRECVASTGRRVSTDLKPTCSKTDKSNHHQIQIWLRA